MHTADYALALVPAPDPFIPHSYSLIWADDISVSRCQQPLAFSLHPDVCEAPVNGFPRVGRGPFRHDPLPPHHDDHLSAYENSLNLTCERRISEGAGLDRSFTCVNRFVKWIIDDVIFRPISLHCRYVVS